MDSAEWRRPRVCLGWKQGGFLTNKFQQEQRCVRLGGGGGGAGGGGGGVVVVSCHGPHEALEWVFYWFLVKNSDEKELVTDRPTNRATDRPSDRPTDTPSYRDARTHLKRFRNTLRWLRDLRHGARMKLKNKKIKKTWKWFRKDWFSLKMQDSGWLLFRYDPWWLRKMQMFQKSKLKWAQPKLTPFSYHVLLQDLSRSPSYWNIDPTEPDSGELDGITWSSRRLLLKDKMLREKGSGKKEVKKQVLWTTMRLKFWIGQFGTFREN